MKSSRIIRTYSELITFLTFKERFQYLKLDGTVGEATFGYERIFNQKFYRSIEWKSIRDHVIARDLGCDLAIDGYDIPKGYAIIHHMCPITLEDIHTASKFLLDPEYLITTVHRTHNAIHYGDDTQIFTGIVERSMNDTCPWRK